MENSILKELSIFNPIFDAIYDVVFIHDAETGDVITVNQATCDTFGYTREEIRTLSIGDLSFNDFPYDQKTALERLSNTTVDQPDRFEWLAKNKSGESFWIEIRANKTAFKGKEYYVVVGRNIDRRKQINEQLRLSEEKFSAAFHTAADMISISRVDNGVFVDLNESTEDVLGYRPSELLGRSSIDVGIWPIQEERDRLRGMLNEKGFFRNEEAHLRQKNGKVIVTSISGNLLTVEGEQYVLANIRDISKIVEANIKNEKLNRDLEQRIKERTAQLEEANRELEAFSYSVSHDLRAPLRAIDGFAQIIFEEGGSSLTPDILGYIEKIQNSSEKMDKLIVGLLDLARFDRKFTHPEPIDLSEMAYLVYQDIIEKYPQRRISFVVEDGLQAYGDRVLLDILFTNLIENAVKFTKERNDARISIGSVEYENQMVFFIKDNGIGFDPKFAFKIFEPFQRLHSEKEYEGIGIGLALARRVVNHHQGRIWVESEKGVGTTFFFELNLEPDRA